MTSQQTEANEFLQLLSFWQLLRKNIWIILGITLVATAVAVFFTLGQTKIYEARAVLQIDPSPPSPLGREVQSVASLGSDSYWSSKEYYATQYKLIQSRRVATTAVAELNLKDDTRFVRNLPHGAAIENPKLKGDAVDALLGRLGVDPIRDSRLVNVTFLDADPKRAERVLSAVVNAYLDSNVDDVVSSIGSASDWLRDQVKNLKTELEDSELALHSYRKDKDILSLSLDDQSEILREEIRQLNQALTEVRVRRVHLGSRHAELSALDASNPSEIPSRELLDSELLRQLRSSYLEATQAADSLRQSGKGENHPEMRAATARVDATREALTHEIANVKGALERELEATTKEANGLSGLLQTARKHAFDLGLLEIEYGRLERTKENTEKLYSVVMERSKETDLTGALRFNNIRVVQPPLASSRPVKPQVPVNIGLGVVIGLGLGLLTALGRGKLDRSIRTSEQIEHELGLPYLGSLPQVASRSAKQRRRRAPRDQNVRPELLVHRDSAGHLAEATRTVRTNLMLMSPDHPFRVFLVTSSQASEGKTTVASAIAIAMAQAGQRVLLMDCDLRQSRLHTIFDTDNAVGVTGVTVGSSDIEHATFQTDVPNLSILTAGPRPPNPAEVLQSESFKNVLNRLREMYDRIVIDSPPVALVADGLVLAAQVDASVFVVRAGKTSRDSARKAARSLRDVSARLAGVVLNAIDQREDGYYGTYYAYRAPEVADAE